MAASSQPRQLGGLDRTARPLVAAATSASVPALLRPPCAPCMHPANGMPPTPAVLLLRGRVRNAAVLCAVLCAAQGGARTLYALGANRAAVRCVEACADRLMCSGDDGKALMYTFK